MNLDDCNGCGGGPCHGDCEKFKHEPYTIDNAVRDITSISVAPAAKSEVRRILEKLIKNYETVRNTTRQ